jgi:TRAP-type mannitol/chloroaromatic compound transport system substrate-binding protein
MKRREFLSRMAVGSAGALAVGLSARKASASPPRAYPKVTWEMATSWPPFLDTLFAGAQSVCDTVAALTDGRFTIHASPAGPAARVPALGVLPAVQAGTVQIGHTASYYYLDVSRVTAFGTGIPFGLTGRQQNAWLFEGGGLAMLQSIYARRFGVIQFPAGNTGAQMGGWFKQEVPTVASLQGLKMRIGGLGRLVMQKLGVTAVTIGATEIKAALLDGRLHAAEFVGPHDDEALGLHTAATNYYFPGWWEPAATLEIEINLEAWSSLPAEYQSALELAAYHANAQMLERYDARNYLALARLRAGGTQLRAFSDEIMDAAYDKTTEVLNESAAADPDFAAVLASWSEFRAGIHPWHATCELALEEYNARRAP